MNSILLHILKLFIIFFSLFGASITYGQSLDHVQGEILVHLDSEVNAQNWAKSFSKSQPFKISIQKRISPILDFYVVHFDFTAVNEERLLLKLLRHESVYMAQYNHFVNLRSTIPDDPEFVNQWQYINLGQDGGTEGADIDMDLAWDIATGGVTANGDTIVACIIDDGIDNDHNDITPNLFINYAEIPDNGIDDDGNGFIDDYRGWNTSSNNDNVYSGGGHGTPVAGIVGAKGNDGFGVAGVNWDVKLMIVRGGTGVESEVLEAYSYPLSFRKKYNETNGEEGAFVVSTNASWGIDLGQPADAPLWCAFYDTLGQAGILNCGATANANFNIDEVGDLPTGCSSDHMIAVTNMNRNDQKVNNAGYGLETIDLGAFGRDTWTTQFGGGFSGFGGTSGATPHVTGTIALLYSLPCENIASLALESPAEVSLMMKEFIMQGVDPNQSLDGITVSGGRLNVANSMQLLLTNFCGDCPPPLSKEVDFIADTEVNVNFSINDSIKTTDFRYRQVGSATWNEILDVESPVNLLALVPCAEYEFEFKGNCDLDTNQYSNTTTFVTAGCCTNPNQLEVLEIFDDNVLSSWFSVPAAISYNVRFRVVGSTDWTIQNTVDTFYQLNNLISCTSYEIQVQSVCNLLSPAYTESIEFFTSGCEDACSENPYCAVPGFDSDEEWIGNITFGSLINSSDSDDGYGDFTDVPSEAFVRGGNYEFSIEPSYSADAFLEDISVWIDFNQNGEFEENEVVFEETGINSVTTSMVTINQDAIPGSTRMRVMMQFEGVQGPCTDGDFQEFGEVEDYCVTIGCPNVNVINTGELTETTAELITDWDINSDDIQYRFRVLGSEDWQEGSDFNSTFTISDLEKCTEYEIEFRSVCQNQTTEYTGNTIFKTLCESSVVETKNGIVLSISPNPFLSIMKLNVFTNNSIRNGQLVVVNHLGQVIYDRSLYAEAGESSISIDANEWSSGLYFVQIKADGLLVTKKITKI